ncbi:glycosyl hydrolase 115 family protein [Aquimarina sp. ERC-38]|uniref:glycosyl hydrolase 115 family protein n=1 Tax=Aquimarina sp. ERC-38 TaxID=2949996 RepID=UPI002248402B|nr:glycosyl hydrolase 115 family protein [Aquimarina sp. ERC-38]UZO79648.1 glycosyl hydrolase 115 family protein [Aquimarina sp. ERC-38]
MIKNIIALVMVLHCSISVAFSKNMVVHNNVVMHQESPSDAVQYAIKALRQDLHRKFGTSISDKPKVDFYFKIDTTLHKFDTYKIEFKKQSIHFTGSDELGLVHAIYTFSEEYLGIDPFIYFTDLMPTIEESITIKIGVITSKPYTFKHRAFFVNDEDLITGFRMEKQEYGFNMEFMEKFYETMLRLKLTGTIPSTLVFSDEAHLKLASDMGLYICQNAGEVVGSVPLFWPKNIPYSWSTHKEYFIEFWTKAIERQAGKNVIWNLGFRGLLDHAFWDDDPNISDDSPDTDKARVINEAIATQYELVKKITGNPNPLVSGYLWGHVGGLYRKGLIKFPENTILLFADTGYGVFPDRTFEIAKKGTTKKGIYQHVSYHNRKSHLRINTIHPNVLHREISKAIDHNMTEMGVLNMSNMKEKIFGIHQVVNYFTDFKKYKNYPSGNYYFDWYVDQKYQSKSTNLKQSYKDFFSNQFDLGDPERKPGDEWYSYYVEMMLNMVHQRKVNTRFFKSEFPGNRKSEFIQLKGFEAKINLALKEYYALYQSAEQLWEVSVQRSLESAGELSGNRRNFYFSDLVYPTQKLWHLTGMAADLTLALQYYVIEDYHQAQLATYAAHQHAKKALLIEQQIEENASGKFEGWYRWDDNAMTWRIEKHIATFLQHTKDMKFFNLPYKYRNSKTRGSQYKYQPWFESEYQKELIYLENAK